MAVPCGMRDRAGARKPVREFCRIATCQRVYSSTVFLLLNLWTFPSTQQGFFPLSLSFFFSPRVLQCTLIVAKNKKILLFNPSDPPSPPGSRTAKHTHNNNDHQQRLFYPHQISTASHTQKKTLHKPRYEHPLPVKKDSGN